MRTDCILEQNLFESNTQSVLSTTNGEKIGELVRSGDLITAITMSGVTFPANSQDSAIEFLFKALSIRPMEQPKGQYSLNDLFND